MVCIIISSLEDNPTDTVHCGNGVVAQSHIWRDHVRSLSVQLDGGNMGKSSKVVSNWSSYNQALKKRGSLTVWIDANLTEQWYCQHHHGRRGRGLKFSNLAIETAMTLKVLFKLPLRALEGFINSLFSLMHLPLRSPDYSSISRRAKFVEINYRPTSRGEAIHLVVDASGLKVFGAGEWRQKKYGLEKRRTWRKLHLAVDADTHDIVAAVPSLANVSDPEALPTLLKPLRRRIRELSADGAYDTRKCYQVALSKGAKVVIPPRKTAALWEKGHPRNEAVKALKRGELAQWKVEYGYHRRSMAETAFSRYKQLLGPRLTFRAYNAQVGEMLSVVKILNQFTRLGMPIRKMAA